MIQTSPTTTVTVHGVLSPVLPSGTSPISRCDAESAVALHAIMTGTLPLTDALLYYSDWCLERTLLVAEQRGFSPAHVLISRGLHR
jgi:hypothetical protein